MSEQISFTGHRHLSYKDVVSHLESVHRDHPGAEWVVGGAVGLDSHAAEFAMSHGIKFSLVLPFPSAVMTKFWSPAQRDVLARSVKQCSKLSVLAPAYDKMVYQARNVRMVDMSDMLVAFFDGSPGGTANCVRYAASMGKTVVRFNGKEEASASSPTSEHDHRIVQAAKSPQAPAPYNFEWEAHMDCLMAPPEQLQEAQIQVPAREDSPGRLIDVYDYITSGDKMKKVVIGKAELIQLERKEFPTKTIFLPEFPVPVVCQEFCDKHSKCHLREENIGDLCRNSGKFGKLVHEAHLKYPKTTINPWIKSPSPSRMRDNSKYLGYYEPDRVADAILAKIRVVPWEYRAYMEDELTPRRIYVGDDNMIQESELNNARRDEDNNGDDEYASPAQQAREFGDRDAVGFIPAFIFGPGKPEWRAIIKEDRTGFPYTKLIKYPSIKAIACKVKMQNGYVVPVGKFGSVVKITTRADKKRMRAFTAIRKELTPYVGVERAGKMAGREVAAMATC